jgi:hypothetical protein
MLGATKADDALRADPFAKATRSNECFIRVGDAADSPHGTPVPLKESLRTIKMALSGHDVVL